MTTDRPTNFKPKPYRRVASAAREVGYTSRWVYRLIEFGYVDSYDDDGLILVRMSSLYAYISKQARKRVS